MKKRTFQELTFYKNVISSFSTQKIKAGANPPNTSFGTPHQGCPFACKIPAGH